MVEDFETLLKQVATERRNKEAKTVTEEKLWFIEVDFKCWCHSKGKFYNLNEQDFKEYLKEYNIKLDFATKMKICEQWFGYEFEYDTETEKWKTLKNKKWVLNRQA